MHRTAARVGVLVAVSALALLAAVTAFASAITGPSSSQSPYVVRSQPGVVTTSILTTGDSVGDYRMVGIPDGLGAFDNGDGTFTVLMNHELGAAAGVTRAHGSKGAFVSKWTIRRDDLSVVSGEDLIENVHLVSGEPALGRLCSADLPAPSALYDEASGMGFQGRLFMDGEEIGAEGRGFAHALNGESWELPRLGKFSWENSVANPATGERTVVVGLDDSTPGQVYVYVGDKTTTGSPVDRAGLTNGLLYGIKVTGFATEPVGGIPAGTPFTLASLGNRQASTGTALQADSVAAGVTEFNRPEDGAWDTQDPSVFYFVTTASFTGNTRLWKVDFVDPADPSQGGTITAVLDGTEGPKMMDNMTVNARGQVLVQEDVGNNAHIGKIWLYDPDSDSLTEVAHHDEARFLPGAPGFLTQDEESSGIIPAPFLGEGWYLLDVQAHFQLGGELVEGGQLLAMHVPPGKFPAAGSGG
jgi:Alkaline phosphatase PhoX